MKKIVNSIFSYLDWYSSTQGVSYDRMDYWSSKSGIVAKKLFYKNKLIGAPLAAWGLMCENFLPQIQKLYSRPHREVIGDAQMALGYFSLYDIYDKDEYLQCGEKLLEIMLEYATNNYTGLAWGYSFSWQQSKDGFWKAGIPLITITPYAFWSFVKHYYLTGDKKSKKIALSIADFALHDLNKTKMPNGTSCYSYSPVSNDVVINSNTYRAALLLDAYKLSGEKEYEKSANESINFVLSYQGAQGEWFYEAKGEESNFIDNFHTCFVLRNLYFCYLNNKNDNILKAVKKGYEYYRGNLFYKGGRPKHFSKSKYMKMRKYEMYDYAEGIKLGVLLKDVIPGAFEKSLELAIDLIDNFQTKEGCYITRITSLGTKHTVPYIRWPQAQIFYSLAELLKNMD